MARATALIVRMIRRFRILTVLVALLLTLGSSPQAQAAREDEVLTLQTMRIGPGYFQVAAITDPDTGKVTGAEVAWSARALPQLRRGDRLVFIDGRAVAGMSLTEFEEFSRGQRTPGERIVLVFKGIRGWLKKREITLELELVSTAERDTNEDSPKSAR